MKCCSLHSAPGRKNRTWNFSSYETFSGIKIENFISHLLTCNKCIATCQTIFVSESHTAFNTIKSYETVMLIYGLDTTAYTALEQCFHSSFGHFYKIIRLKNTRKNSKLLFNVRIVMWSVLKMSECSWLLGRHIFLEVMI